LIEDNIKNNKIDSLLDTANTIATSNLNKNEHLIVDGNKSNASNNNKNNNSNNNNKNKIFSADKNEAIKSHVALPSNEEINQLLIEQKKLLLLQKIAAL
jgi:hypothetical protein